MKKVFLLFAAMMTATVMNLHAVDITSWTIVGASALMGSQWDEKDTNNDMRVFGGSYQLKKFAWLSEGDYEYKACANHAWAVKEIPTSENQTFHIEDDGDYIITFTLDMAGTTLSAKAELNAYSGPFVDTYVNDKSMGSVTGAGEYELDEQVTLTATPNAGYKFVNWSGDQTGTENPLSITVSTFYTAVQANFEAETPAGPDMHDFLYFVGLNGNDTVRMNKWSYFGATSLAKLTATFEYSKDRINWTAYDTWGEATSVEASDGYFAFGNSIALNQGDTVFFRAKGTNGKNATMSSTELTYFYFAFGVDDSIAAGGNIMSLYDATCEQDTMTRVGFCGLFKDAKQLISTPKLPATKLAQGCYYEMFFGCTSLTTAPALPVTTLAVNCYSYMFQDCSSLTQAPELKATTMAFMCYGGMFSGCTSLTTAPALPATKLDGSCYNGMFSGCTALTQAPELKATTLDIHCYYEMFKGCTSLQVDTLSGDCDGAELEVPSPASEPGWWNQNMFAGCHGDAKYTAEYGIKLGGHYCIKEFIPDTIKGIELIAVDTVYDGQNHYIQVNGTIEGDAVTYSTDSATWQQDTIQLKNVCEQTVYVRIRRTDHIDWGGKSSIKIAKKVLTVDSVIIAEKVYDGTSTATVKSSKLVGVVKGESVGLDVRGDFNDKNAGKDKDVTVEYRLEGSDAVISNYTLQTASETLKATITPKTLTVTGTTASEKEYDGNTTASVTAGTLSGIIESDDVQISTATGAFEDKNAGESKNVITTYTLRGADADNYTTPTDTILANITPKPLTISGTTIAAKTYDGMYNADVDVLGTVEGIIAGETVKVTATAYFNDKDAGEGKDAFVEYSVEGEGYTNYQAPQASYHTANINKRPITITSGSAMKVFDNMPLTNNKVEVTEGSWADDEGAELNATGSQTQVGSSPNYFDIIYNANTTGANYDITIVEGTLTVKDYGTCAEANATPVDEVLGLKPVVVTYVNGAYTYVKDATGASLIYAAGGYGLKAGDQVTGFIGESAPDEYGLPRIFPSKKSSELTIVAGAAPEPELRTAMPTMNEIHQYVRYENVKIGSALLTPATPVEATLNNGDQIMLDSKFGSSYMIEGGEDITYDIVAIVGVRDEVMELYPIVIAIHTSVNLNDVNADNRVVEKYVKDGQLYIRVNGVLYNASGIRVK